MSMSLSEMRPWLRADAALLGTKLPQSTSVPACGGEKKEKRHAVILTRSNFREGAHLEYVCDSLLRSRRVVVRIEDVGVCVTIRRHIAVLRNKHSVRMNKPSSHNHSTSTAHKLPRISEERAEEPIVSAGRNPVHFVVLGTERRTDDQPGCQGDCFEGRRLPNT